MLHGCLNNKPVLLNYHKDCNEAIYRLLMFLVYRKPEGISIEA